MATAEWFHAFFFFWCTFFACVWKYVCQKHEETSLIISKHPLVSPTTSLHRPTKMLPDPEICCCRRRRHCTKNENIRRLRRRQQRRWWRGRKWTCTRTCTFACMPTNQPFRRHPCTPCKSRRTINWDPPLLLFSTTTLKMTYVCVVLSWMKNHAADI